MNNEVMPCKKCGNLPAIGVPNKHIDGCFVGCQHCVKAGKYECVVIKGSTEEAVAEWNKLNDPSLPMEYQPEMWSVPKDTIYAAATAIQLALGYMPLIKTDVPQFQKTLVQDVARMIAALEELRKLDCFLGTGLQSKD